jgi:hypothetical protein
MPAVPAPSPPRAQARIDAVPLSLPLALPAIILFLPLLIVTLARRQG